MNPARASSSAIVIGGGVIGLFTAWRLRDAGFAVTVVERDRIGGSASWAAGGILSPLPPWQAPPAVWAVAAESIAAYPGIAATLHAATGIDPEWTPSGMRVLEVADGPAALAWAARSGHSVACVDADTPRPTLHLPWVAQVRSPRLLQALRAYLTQRGVSWRERESVTGATVQAGHLQAVHTATGQRLGADLVVLCAGAWSAELAAALGDTVRVAPVRGQMLRFGAAAGLLNEIVLREGFYLIPRSDGSVVAGSTLEHVGYDASPTTEGQATLLQAALAMLPGLRPCPVTHHWAAVRPGTEQGIPVIRRSQVAENLWLHAGHYRNGITLAPASAAALLRQWAA